MKERTRRKSFRLKGYDYQTPGFYFVTICTHDHNSLFGKIEGGVIGLNKFGEIANKCWINIPKHFTFVDVDEFVVMPDHIHGIIHILEGSNTRRGAACCAPTNMVRPGSLAAIIRSYKSAVTKSINSTRHTPGAPVWQRSFYDHIIRDDEDLEHIREYILNNDCKPSKVFP